MLKVKGIEEVKMPVREAQVAETGFAKAGAGAGGDQRCREGREDRGRGGNRGGE